MVRQEVAVTPNSRSREGAWIEIHALDCKLLSLFCRSREGAWIEIADMLYTSKQMAVAPARERGLKYEFS